MRARILTPAAAVVFLATAIGFGYGWWDAGRDNDSSTVVAEPTTAPAAASRYLRDEAIALVKLAFQREPKCENGEAWTARLESGSWFIGLGCFPTAVPKANPDLDPFDAFPGRWRLEEATGQVIPMSDEAVKMMKPVPTARPRTRSR